MQTVLQIFYSVVHQKLSYTLSLLAYMLGFYYSADKIICNDVHSHCFCNNCWLCSSTNHNSARCRLHTAPRTPTSIYSVTQSALEHWLSCRRYAHWCCNLLKCRRWTMTYDLCKPQREGAAKRREGGGGGMTERQNRTARASHRSTQITTRHNCIATAKLHRSRRDVMDAECTEVHYIYRCTTQSSGYTPGTISSSCFAPILLFSCSFLFLLEYALRTVRSKLQCPLTKEL